MVQVNSAAKRDGITCMQTGDKLVVDKETVDTSGESKGLLQRLRHQVIALAKEKDPPHRIALGGALGIFIGLLPIMGIQMAVVSILAIPLRGNLKAAIAGVWISNPITFIPLYFANYKFGLLFFSNNKVGWEEFSSVIKLAARWNWGDVSASMSNLMDMGTDILIPLWGGSAILGILFAPVTYAALYKIVTRHRVRAQIEKEDF